MKSLMKWVSKHIMLAPFMILLIIVSYSCKTEKIPVPPPEQYEMEIKEHLIPLPSELLHINAKTKIGIDPKGLPKLEINPLVFSDTKKKPKVDISLSEDGELNVDVTVPPDTTYVPVVDKTITKTKTLLVEKELTGWQKFCIKSMKLLLLVILVIAGVRIYKIFK